MTVDSRVVATVDLRRSTFSARVALFTRSWSGTGNHWIQISIVGSGRPVAVDEFVITRSTTR